MVNQCYQHTTPGGWVELQDFDSQYYSQDESFIVDSFIRYWSDTLLDASRKFRRDPSPGPKLETYLQEAGFQDVKVEKYLIPLGPWPKDPKLVS